MGLLRKITGNCNRDDSNIVRSISRHHQKSRSTNRAFERYGRVLVLVVVAALFFLFIVLVSISHREPHTYITAGYKPDLVSSLSLSNFLATTTDQDPDPDQNPSVHATVMGMATNYNKKSHQRFVGSLRYSGFKGHIILGIEPEPLPGVLQYLISQNVTIRQLSYTPCTYSMKAVEENRLKNVTDSHIEELGTCAHPYADIKIRWSRFPLLRDWLQECATCTGPVLVTDVRDALFQRNPFGSRGVINSIRGLQVFEEHESVTTMNWLTEWPIRECKGVTYDEPMLCSGTTVGTRTAMLQYLNTMYDEMKVWIADPKCRFEINGDDQSIHNYVYYSGKLKNAISIPFRQPGSIVNTIGAYGGNFLFAIYSRPKKVGDSQSPYPGSTYHLPQTAAEAAAATTSTRTWIGVEMNVTNAEGLFVDADGTTISPVIHQYDRLGPYYEDWLKQQPWTTYS